jgi:hypothetical protein
VNDSLVKMKIMQRNIESNVKLAGNWRGSRTGSRERPESEATEKASAVSAADSSMKSRERDIGETVKFH